MAFLGSQQLTTQRSAFFGGIINLNAAARPQRTMAPGNSLVVQAAVIGPGKRWEHYELNKNGKPVRVKMHIKTGDTVQVIAGGDKGKIGKVLKVNTKTGEVLLDGVNVKTKHVKPSGEEEGQITKVAYPIHHSNVQHYSEASQVRSRIGMKIGQDGKKVRYLKKTGEELS